MPPTAKSSASAVATAVTTAVAAAAKHRPRVLLVDDEPGLVDVLTAAVAPMNCTVTVARTLAAAKRALADGGCDLLVADVGLPDGSGLGLLPLVRRYCPSASTIVITGSPTVDGAVSALRDGAVDFLPKPFDAEQIVTRVRQALDRQAANARSAARVTRLRSAVRRLSAARRTVSQKVDLLCNDLIGAYTDLARQVDTVRHGETFRKHIAVAGDDLEQLLCHTMDWLLRELGPANVALWLASDDGAFQLGAYMKHTTASSEPIVDAMRDHVLPAVVRDGMLHLPGGELPGKPTKAQRAAFAAQDVMAISATYLGEPLAALIFFRDAAAPFTDDDADVLRAISPVFATTLAGVVRGPSADDDDAPEGLHDTDDDDDENGDDDGPWFKRGGLPQA